MLRKRRKQVNYKYAKFLAAVLLGTICLAPPVQNMTSFPSDIQIPAGQKTNLPIPFHTHARVVTSNARVVQVNRSYNENPRQVEVFSRHVGEATVSSRLFGIFPWKAVHVKVVPSETVYVGGQSVGIRLRSKGAIVIGYQRPNGQDSPAGIAHVQIGDVIEQINTQPIHDSADIRRLTNLTTQDIKLIVRRGTEHHTINVKPFTDESGIRHLGLFVRDKTAGVGTLTFYDQHHQRFGALGHIITDADTGQAMQGTGELFGAQITGLVKGTVGQPGEKKGHFTSERNKLGEIDENTPYGVFGTMNLVPKSFYSLNPMPVALPAQVHTGPAKILTVLHGEQIEAFDVNVENLTRQEEPSTKSMIIKVTDPKLLSASGGIVQGMSGSPIIQDGRLIGAVTHVFVSDPTRGYGVYAQWMLKQCEATDKTLNDTFEEIDDLRAANAK